ncbi:MAG: hypothetical protein ACK5A0_10765 [Polaromonas sp.]
MSSYKNLSIKGIAPGVPDLQSLRNARQMGYELTPTGPAWMGLHGWEKPNDDPFPMPALVFVN